MRRPFFKFQLGLGAAIGNDTRIQRGGLFSWNVEDVVIKTLNSDHIGLRLDKYTHCPLDNNHDNTMHKEKVEGWMREASVK